MSGTHLRSCSWAWLIGAAACSGLAWVTDLSAATASGSSFRKVVLATQLQEPIQLSLCEDGRVFFGERKGGVKVWKPSTGETITLGRLNVFSGPEDGLLGLALDPGFLTNHWLFVFQSKPGKLENQVSRFTVNEDRLEAASERTLLRIPTLLKKPNHSGGGLGFDALGNLYASTGDYSFINDSKGFSPLDERPGRELFDSQRTAANTMDLRGKILRIHPEPDASYTIPGGNLFPVGTSNALPEIYIMGCRNPFRFTVDRETGWLIWGDVGPDAPGPDPLRGPAGFDEFNLAKSAGNFGWPYFVADNKPYIRHNFATLASGSPFDPKHPVNESRNNTGLKTLPPAQPAMIWYPPGPSTRFPEMGSGPRSAMAGPIYHFNPLLKSARQFPASFDRVLFLFEWERSQILQVRLRDDGQFQSMSRFLPDISFKRPISMSFGPDGALYLIEWGTAWYNNPDAQLVRVESAL